jgi:putative ABC transport system ATP-binding protein
MERAPTIVLNVRHLNHYFGEGDARNQVLFDNSLQIGRGEFVVMTGPSGSGKTTLLTLIGALRSLQSGHIDVLGHDLAKLSASELVAVRRKIGFIFQAHNLFDSLSALENVMLAMEVGDVPRSQMKGAAAAILDRLGLGHRYHYKPRSLSGGQRQRVAVARALVNRPRLVLADEPTAALDRESAQIVSGLLKELTAEHGCTVIMVTHDTRLIELADRVVNMVDGSIRSDVVLNEAVVICEFLRRLPLFERLSPVELTNVAGKMKGVTFDASDVVLREGDSGEDFFLIREGKVGVYQSEGGEGPVATLGSGECFGEQALIADRPRNATVIAQEKLTAYRLAKDDFRAAIDASPSFKEQLYEIYFQRQ